LGQRNIRRKRAFCCCRWGEIGYINEKEKGNGNLQRTKGKKNNNFIIFFMHRLEGILRQGRAKNVKKFPGKRRTGGTVSSRCNFSEKRNPQDWKNLCKARKRSRGWIKKEGKDIIAPGKEKKEKRKRYWTFF